MNPKLLKVVDEIDMLKRKILRCQSRLRSLDRQKIEIENAEIVALVRGIDIAPDKLGEFARAYAEQQAGKQRDFPLPPELPQDPSNASTEKTDKEVSAD